MKKAFAFLIALLLLVPFGTAFAAETGTAQSTTRTQLQAKKQTLKDIHASNDALRTQNKALAQQAKDILKTLRSTKDAASEQKLEQAKTILQNLQQSKTSLKDLRGAGKPYWEQFKTNVQSKNFDAALSNLDSIAVVRTNRHDILVQINTTLNSLLAAIN
jgi:septal ring factor EnvC (AmiA/AmiB activator)